MLYNNCGLDLLKSNFRGSGLVRVQKKQTVNAIFLTGLGLTLCFLIYEDDIFLQL